MDTTILVIDDDEELCALLSDYLKLEGFSVRTVHDGAEGITLCRQTNFDAVILDIMLPSVQGLDVLRELRQFSQVPVLMLTARGADTDRIVGLEMGADDYLPKPCNPRELAARLRAILRRTEKKAPELDNRLLTVGNLTLDSGSRNVKNNQTTLNFTGAEFNLLAVLMRQAGIVVSKETLCEEALGRPLTAYDRSVDVHISKLRKKLDNSNTQIINVRGAGYQLTSSDEGKP